VRVGDVNAATNCHDSTMHNAKAFIARIFRVYAQRSQHLTVTPVCAQRDGVVADTDCAAELLFSTASTAHAM
jgi:hypothetical protein